jgi:hypothetical protein
MIGIKKPTHLFPEMVLIPISIHPLFNSLTDAIIGKDAVIIFSSLLTECHRHFFNCCIVPFRAYKWRPLKNCRQKNKCIAELFVLTGTQQHQNESI